MKRSYITKGYSNMLIQ